MSGAADSLIECLEFKSFEPCKAISYHECTLAAPCVLVRHLPSGTCTLSRGSRDPNNRVLGHKYHNDIVFWLFHPVIWVLYTPI